MRDIFNVGSTTLLVAVVLILTVLAYGLVRSRAMSSVSGDARKLHSLPIYYGYNAAMLTAIPALFVLAIWMLVQPMLIQNAVIDMIPQSAVNEGSSVNLVMSDVRRVANGLDAAVQSGALDAQSARDLDVTGTDVRALLAGTGVALGSDVTPEVLAAAQRYRSMEYTGRWLMIAVISVLALAGLFIAMRTARADFRARNTVERFLLGLLVLAASLAILTTVGIVLSVLFESIRFFGRVPVTDFLFGLQWSPQTALRADQVASGGAFGAVPLFMGTLLISAIALLVAVPVGLMSAIYLAEYASNRVRTVAKPALEVLAGVPTVVYGFFAALTVAPFIRGLGESIGLNVASESALAAGLVMGIMIIPFVSSLADDVITAVPQAMRDGSLGLGATKSETIKKVIFPAALPGIMGGILLAASRAIGETMIVVMAAGLAANLTANPLEAVTTITVQIVTLLTGDQEFDSAKTLAAFALGLMLFITTLVMNIFALHIVKKYREQYD